MDFFGDFDNDKKATFNESENYNKKPSQEWNRSPQGNRSSQGNRWNDGNYSEDLFSRKVETTNRTYFFDLKQSMRWVFLKISERSRWKRTTIMIDSENIKEFSEALDLIKEQI